VHIDTVAVESNSNDIDPGRPDLSGKGGYVGSFGMVGGIHRVITTDAGADLDRYADTTVDYE